MNESEFVTSAIKQARFDVAQALQRLESVSGRVVTGLSLDTLSYDRIGGSHGEVRNVVIDLAPRPGEGWSV